MPAMRRSIGKFAQRRGTKTDQTTCRKPSELASSADIDRSGTHLRGPAKGLGATRMALPPLTSRPLQRFSRATGGSLSRSYLAVLVCSSLLPPARPAARAMRSLRLRRAGQLVLTDWDVDSSGDDSIQGFATSMSVNRGHPWSLAVNNRSGTSPSLNRPHTETAETASEGLVSPPLSTVSLPAFDQRVCSIKLT